VCANHGAQCPVSPRYARPSRADPAVAREALRPPWPALETRKTSHQRATQALHQLKHGCLGCPSSRVSPIRSPFLLQVYSLLKPRPTLRPTLRRMPPDRKGWERKKIWCVKSQTFAKIDRFSSKQNSNDFTLAYEVPLL
jgi:hypothetical protein